MTPLTVLLLSCGVFAVARSRDIRNPERWAALTGAVSLAPVIGALGGATWAALHHRSRLVEARQKSENAQAEEVLLVHALLIALTGGLGLASAMLLAEKQLDSELRESVAEVVRRGSTMGLGPALQSATGPGARLFRQLGATHESGAPVVMVLSSYAHELHEANRARTLQRARQLPVKLLLPLTLLMLPGFLLLTIGPTVLSSFSRLLGPFGGP